jgi:hypothetical protein
MLDEAFRKQMTHYLTQIVASPFQTPSICDEGCLSVKHSVDIFADTRILQIKGIVDFASFKAMI